MSIFGGSKASVDPESVGLLYVVYDRVAERCAGLFECENDAVAARFYKRGMNEVPESEWEDFKLVKVGSFDHKKMDLIGFEDKSIINVSIDKIEEEKDGRK